LAFGDLIETSKFKKVRFGSEFVRNAENWGRKERRTEAKFSLSPWRLMFVYVGFIAIFLIIFARAFDLQVIKGYGFLNKAEGNRVQLLTSHAPRGVIYDRNGKILAQNVPSIRLVLDPSYLPSERRKEVIDKLSQILKVNKNPLNKKFKQVKDKPITLVNNLPTDKSLVIEAEAGNLPGIQLEVRPIRLYPYKDLMSHLLGYTLEADEKDIEKQIPSPYVLGDQVGKAGIEQAAEGDLRGVNGYRLISVSASGEKKGEIYNSNPITGQDITLSIDLDLQKFVYSSLNKMMRKEGARGGSAVVLNSNTGELLAMVSIPSFDNNFFSKGIERTRYNTLISSQTKPLINRAIGASYPPGSTFKIVSSVAGLESGTISPNTKIVDPGYVTLGNQVFKNWLWNDQRRTEGAINVVRALARSTDTFYYRLGQKMGEEPLIKYAQIFGLGKKTEIELPEEISGLVPTEEWKLKTKGEPWYPGETLNLSIGQGDLLVTPLQLAVVTLAVANGGKLVRPTIYKTKHANIIKQNFLKKVTIDTVKEGMYKNTVGDGNVGWLFAGFNTPSAGKTGTAESGQEMPHAWYTGYAPHPNAKIVATVMVEYAGHGSELCAPVVKDIFNWYFKNR
jgi:penicillin-binding protein 2